MFVALALCVIAVAGVCILTGCSSSSPSGADDAVEADLVLAPAMGTVITDILFDASGSTGRSRALECRWDYDGDGAWDTSWDSEMSFVARFSDGDTITVVVEVRDGDVTDEAEAQFVLDKMHGHIVSDVMVPGTDPRALGWGDGWIWRPQWLSNSAVIYKTDPTTGGADVDSLLAPSLWLEGVAWDGEHLYQGISFGAGNPGNKIRKYTMSGGFVEELPAPRGIHPVQGLAYDGLNLWVAVADVDTLYAVDPSDGTVRFTTPAPNLLYGVTVDDEGMLWVHRTGAGYHVAKLVP